MHYNCLLSRGNIGRLKLKNRIVMPPMQTSYADVKGFITERQIDYYTERAKGGVGLIIFEHTGVLQQGKASPHMSLLCDDEHIAGFQKLVGHVHREAAKIAVQLNHAGRQTSSATTGTPLVAPSPIPCPFQKEMPQELSADEIHAIAEAFSVAAERAVRSGADAVEIHMAHGYLIAEFLSPLSNKRKDAYGGDTFGRTKFAVEVLNSVRKKVGSDFPLICRLSGDEYVEGGLRLEDTREICRVLGREGADAFHISAALGGRPMNQPTYYADEGALVHLAEGVKRAVSVPVITVGRIRDLDFAERLIQEGKVDFVAMGRALIADPHMPKKTIEGRTEDIIRCLSCNRCLQSLATGPMICTVNPEVGREKEFMIERVSNPKRVLVVGGGPAGLKASQVAALRGHEVTLFEKAEKLGGNMRLAAVPPKKECFLEPITYLEAQLRKLPVTLRLRETCSIETVEMMKPDIVIVATGSKPYRPDIKGIDECGALSAVEVLGGKKHFGHKVAVVGGGGIGAEVADFLSEQGVEVSLIEMRDKVALDLPGHLQYHLAQRLQDKGVAILTSSKVVEFHKNALTIEDSDGKRLLSGFDSIVLALGSISDHGIEEELRNRGIEVYVIGDAKSPREAREAIFEGQTAALGI